MLRSTDSLSRVLACTRATLVVSSTRSRSDVYHRHPSIRSSRFSSLTWLLSLSEEMRSGGSTNRFNVAATAAAAADEDDNDDDDLFSDGPCPSCRLAINQETGRLKCVLSYISLDRLVSAFKLLLFRLLAERASKFLAQCRWCTGGNETRRSRVKPMLLIPAVLLPITIVLIILSRFQGTSKVTESRARDALSSSHNGMHRQKERQTEADIFWREFHHFSHDRDGITYFIIV